MNKTLADRLRSDAREGMLLAFVVLFALVFVRYCCYGLEYFPQLDDYIQYHNYRAYNDDLWQVVVGSGMLASRPLSGTLDVLFWSGFWPGMMGAVALLSALYAGSAVLFRQVWRSYFGTGWLFLILYALLPLGMEGTYWVSASTRVVPSLFFTALAMRLFQRWCAGGKRRFLVLYFFAQLLSFGFYEQGLVLSVTGVILVGLLEFRAHPRRALWALLTFLNAAIYFGFTAAFSQSALYGSRTALCLPWQDGWLHGTFQPVRSAVTDAFLRGGLYTAGKGLVRGVSLIVTEGHWLWLVLVLALCALVFFFARRPEAEGPREKLGRTTALALVVGFLMALAPLTIFFVLESPWFSLRGTVTSFPGLALMADALVALVLCRLKGRRTVTAALSTALALVFCAAAVSEVHDYRETYADDQAVIAAILSATEDGTALPADGTTVLLGVEPTYLEDQNFYFHEHIHGVTESNWALSGAVRCVLGRNEFPDIVPKGSQTTAAELYAMDFDAVWLYDHAAGTLEPVEAVLAEDWNYDLLDAGGDLVARVTAFGLERPEG